MKNYVPGLESTNLGSTNRTVSRIGFGGAPAGLTNYLTEYSPEQADQRQQVIAAIRHAADSGVTYFDTAAAYGNGESERIFGEALEGRISWSSYYSVKPPTRSQEASKPRLVIATKVAHAEPDIRGSVERSLQNLRVNCLDLVQVHGGSYTEGDEYAVMRPGGVLETLEKARDEGLIRHIGFTTEDQNAPVYTFIRSGRFEVMQVQYNLLFQHPYSPDRPFGCMLAARDAGMGIVTMRSLTSGAFQRWMAAIRPDDTFDYSAALLQFNLSNPLVDVALAGMRTPEEVDRNIAVLNDTVGRVDLHALHQKFVT